MALKDLIATDNDRLAAAEQKIDDLRELLRGRPWQQGEELAPLLATWPL